MKKRIAAAAFFTLLVTVCAWVVFFFPVAEAQMRFIVREADGSPTYQQPRGISFPNGSLSTENNLVSVASSAFADNVAGAEAGNATLTLKADESDDSGDDWAISSVASGNALTIGNDTSGSQVTKLSLSTAGVITLSDSETITDASDVLTFTFDDAAATVRIAAFEATAANLTLQADESDDNGDDWTLTNSTGNQLQFTNDTSGAAVLKFGATAAGAFVINGSGPNFAADVEASDTYVITLAPAPTAYAAGMTIRFTATTANTGACTINVNALGAKNLLMLNNQTPADSYIEAGSVVFAVYDGTSFQMIQPDANP